MSAWVRVPRPACGSALAGQLLCAHEHGKGRGPCAINVRDLTGPASSPSAFLSSTRTRPGVIKSRGCRLLNCEPACTRERQRSGSTHKERPRRPACTHVHDPHLEHDAQPQPARQRRNVLRRRVLRARFLRHAPSVLQRPLRVHVYRVDAHPPTQNPAARTTQSSSSMHVSPRAALVSPRARLRARARARTFGRLPLRSPAAAPAWARRRAPPRSRSRRTSFELRRKDASEGIEDGGEDG